MDKETNRVPEEVEKENNGSLRIVYCTVYTEPSIWCAMHFFCSFLCLVSFENYRRSVFSAATTPAFVNISEIFVKQHKNTRWYMVHVWVSVSDQFEGAYTRTNSLSHTHIRAQSIFSNADRGLLRSVFSVQCERQRQRASRERAKRNTKNVCGIQRSPSSMFLVLYNVHEPWVISFFLFSLYACLLDCSRWNVTRYIAHADRPE